jgi:hypothetical protein
LLQTFNIYSIKKKNLQICGGTAAPVNPMVPLPLELWLANGDVCNASIPARQRQLRFTTKVVLRYEREGIYKFKRLVLQDSSKCLNEMGKMCSTCKWIVPKWHTRSHLYRLGGGNRPRLWSSVRNRRKWILCIQCFFYKQIL